MAKQEKAMITKDAGSVKCKHCHKKVTSSILVGISLVCPFCSKPVNGQSH